MTCDTCMHAVWKRTSNGRLHPDKTGRCGFVWVPPPIPKAFYFHMPAKPSGGFIERGEARTDGCPCFALPPSDRANNNEQERQ
jgi:hypothetical protein